MRPLVKIYILRIILGIIAAMICIGYIAATGTILRNLVSNPSIESGNTTPQDWLSTENGTEWSTAYARTGSRSIRINVSDSSAEWRITTTAIQGGYTYQVQGFFRGNISKDSFFLSVRWFSDPQGFMLISETEVSMPVGNYMPWSLVGQAMTAPSDASGAAIVFKTANGTGDMYGDCFEMRQAESVTMIPAKFVNSISIALIVYLVSYYGMKRIFINKVEKPQKIFTIGIGIYFITWLVFSVFIYTLIVGLPVI